MIHVPESVTIPLGAYEHAVREDCQRHGEPADKTHAARVELERAIVGTYAEESKRAERAHSRLLETIKIATNQAIDCLDDVRRAYKDLDGPGTADEIAVRLLVLSGWAAEAACAHERLAVLKGI
jgi:hypothetical protein